MSPQGCDRAQRPLLERCTSVRGRTSGPRFWGDGDWTPGRDAEKWGEAVQSDDRYAQRPRWPLPEGSSMKTSPASRRATSEHTLALWREYIRTNDLALRDRLVLTFAPL